MKPGDRFTANEECKRACAEIHARQAEILCLLEQLGYSLHANRTALFAAIYEHYPETDGYGVKYDHATGEVTVLFNQALTRRLLDRGGVTREE